jgi:hypothetical protein
MAYGVGCQPVSVKPNRPTVRDSADATSEAAALQQAASRRHDGPEGMTRQLLRPSAWFGAAVALTVAGDPRRPWLP